ncbi:hypothetical protein [Merismopedia glauca]|uniref:DUF2281 domain-containing protein n=1 Tax=Merismopedia glauca CCAP 1448/3 TaxID=1296344 RepID=A0A2T1BWL2_9CYAN|nr:hypothetical protein [Merismopedia glauca]PSB00338.1 hypothetical protein C7B64_24065 [Merismopedia glauca CCAP 1448/3]
MNTSFLRTKVLQEIQQVPEEKLAELYDLISSFRVSSIQSSTSTQLALMEFAGCWKDLPGETYTDFLDNISTRHQQAFSTRENRETSPGLRNF